MLVHWICEASRVPCRASSQPWGLGKVTNSEPFLDHIEPSSSRAALPGLPSLSTLIVSATFHADRHSVGEFSDTSHACRYLAAGKWPQLTALDVSLNDMSPEAWKELVKGEWPTLRSLDVTRSLDIEPGRSLSILATAPWPNLAQLQLSGVLVMQHFHRLAQASWPHLTRLEFGGFFSTTLTMLPQAGVLWRGLRLLTVICYKYGYTLGEVVDLLESSGCALETLHLEGYTLTAGSIRPTRRWPTNTQLNLVLPLNEGTLSKLALGSWPIKSVLINQRPQGLQWAEAMHTVVQLDFSGLEKFQLQLSVWKDCTPHDLHEVCEIIANATWPSLKALHLSHAELEDSHLLLLTAGVWPLLQSIGLSGSGVTIHGIEQLVHGNWPHLTSICSSQLQLREATALQPLFAKWPMLKVDDSPVGITPTI